MSMAGDDQLMTRHSRRAALIAAALILPGTVLGAAPAAQGTVHSGKAAGPAAAAADHATAQVPFARAGHRPGAGNPNGHAPVPSSARAVDTSRPTRVVGKGTAASCTSKRVVKAVRRGGLITFSCGPKNVTIKLTKTAKLRNDRHAVTVIDGGGKVTLSGRGKRRVIYMNTCDPAQGITSSHCQDQNTPRLTLQNLTITRGNSTGLRREGGGGGAVFVRGGRLKVVNSRFFKNRCESTGPDLGGAAIRVLDQFRDRPVYIVHSTFGGAKGYGGRCSNGGALSSIGVSWVILNSIISHNKAVGNGANPARPGSPGGGSGAGIYTDGNFFTVTLGGTRMSHNHAREGGGAIFFVSNDRTGTLTIDRSVLRKNPSDGFETAGYPGIFFLGSGHPKVTNSIIQ
jgi:hypothetical protein